MDRKDVGKKIRELREERAWGKGTLATKAGLAPSYIRYASFMANRISLKPYGFNIIIATAIISLFDLAKNFT